MILETHCHKCKKVTEHEIDENCGICSECNNWLDSFQIMEILGKLNEYEVVYDFE